MTTTLWFWILGMGYPAQLCLSDFIYLELWTILFMSRRTVSQTKQISIMHVAGIHHLYSFFFVS